MDSPQELDFLSHLFRQHWISALFLAATLLTILSLLGIRWWLRRRWRKLLEQKSDEEIELDALAPLGPKDQEAIELIKRFRREVWDLPEAELQLSMEALLQRAVVIVRAVSAVYHPEAEVPQYEASLAEILQLFRRVSSKLSRLSSLVPFKILANRRLSHYQRFYQVYRKIQDNAVLQLLKRNPYLYRVAKWAVNVKNLGNPLYWAGKELSREGFFFTVRWFYLTLSSQVGREAMRLYSGRHFQRDEDRDAALTCYRLYSLTRQWGGPSAKEWSVLVDFVTNHLDMDSDTKLHVLSRWSQDRLPKDLEIKNLQTTLGFRWYREGLKRLMEQDIHPLPIKTQLIQREMDGLELDHVKTES